MNKVLNKLNLLDKNGKVSITNSIVLLFVLITAFKVLFSGLVINFYNNKWKVETMDLSTSLPLLFSLINYGHKRKETNKLLSLESNNNVKSSKVHSSTEEE